jgi:hypothetical protein
MYQFSSRSFLFLLALCAAAMMAMGACTNTPTVPTTTPGTPVTDTYSGTLSKSGAFTHSFTITTLGTITATIVSLAPVSTQIVGLQLGVWNGTSCTAASSIDTATTGSSITLNASSAGVLCVRLYDVGFITDPVLYELTVVHP